ncbi:Gp138 family membrane-puncturing spike protein [Paraburkholderia graminis]|uniref:Gp138 family membrane-puncturing spike protein n=1 Tax=Paraburkholderia graminis TaxID=60548 RepID=UPI0038BC398C
MDPRERYDDPEEALRVAMDGLKSGLWTSMPGIVQSFSASAITATVQIAIKGVVHTPDGKAQFVNMPLLVDVPVHFPRGGGCTLTFPVAKGDECLVVFAARCIDTWWQSGGVQAPAEQRIHDLSDGFAFVGFFSQATKISGISTNTAQLRSNDGSTYVEVDPTGQIVNCVAPGGMKFTTPTVTITGVINVQNANSAPTAMAINGNTNFAGQVSANGHRIDDSHKHSGVTTGSGNTGTPL